ncbi:MAG: hydrolase [Pseudarthrobacter sp.]|nr:hydrolase [Pseudarthrobacter sp.]
MDHSLASTPSDAGRPGQPAQNPYLQHPPARTGPRDPGDAWVEGDRGRFWGRFGAAGVLAYDPGRGVLLQHRAEWSHNGGTWGLPGGALHQGEDAVTGALREAHEEAAVPAESVSVLFTSVLDFGYWSYTTVVLLVTDPFEPVISDPESIELLWVPLADVDAKELHPGFAAAWPALRTRMLSLVEAGR